MRILILSQYFSPEPGAAQLRLAAMCDELLKRGHEVEVVTSFPNYPEGRIWPNYRLEVYRCEQWRTARVHRVWLFAACGSGPRRIVNYLSFAATCLLGLFMARRPDYIFVESPPPFVMVAAWIFGTFWRTSLILNISDLWPDSMVALGIVKNSLILSCARTLERWTYDHAARVCAVTDGIRRELISKKNVPPEKVMYLPNGIDLDSFRWLPPDTELKRSLGIEGKHVVVYAGTHSFAHGLETMICTAHVLRARDDIHFLLVGSGSAKQNLVALAHELELPNISFVDAVPPGQIASYYSIALCGMVTLRPDEFFATTRPASSLAMMACEKPVVYAAGKGGGAIIREARAGVVVSVTDAQAAADAICLLASQPELAREYGRNGRLYVEHRASWSVLVDDWLNQLTGTVAA